jgi:hypothetical protein
LQPFRKAFKALRKTDSSIFPVRIGQNKMVNKMYPNGQGRIC